uniref:F-box associated beta-propeller type 3 domain-containing protein n=1 Tax=Arundo donax TaxID=35708 RepID=A0A0A9EXL5_ARUDO
MAGRERVVSIQLDRICTLETMVEYQLLNPATGAVCALPEGFAKEHARKQDIFDYRTFVSFGQVASIGEYKVLRVVDNRSDYRPMQLYKVFTLDGSNHARWRAKKAPSEIVRLGLFENVGIDGIVYFLSYEPGCIASFDLEAERWRQNLQGPLNDISWGILSMATLSGCLVVVHHTHASSMDLWYLMDAEKGLWVKRHSIQINDQCARYKVNPLLVTWC